MLVNLLFRGKKIFRDFWFSFPRRIPGSKHWDLIAYLRPCPCTQVFCRCLTMFWWQSHCVVGLALKLYELQDSKKRCGRFHMVQRWMSADMRVTRYVLQSGFSTTLPTTLFTPAFRRNPPKTVHISIWPSSRTTCLRHWPCWLGYAQNDALEECSGIFSLLKLLSLQLPFDGREQKPVMRG